MLNLIIEIGGYLMIMLGVILFLAFIVETLVEATLGFLMDHIESIKPYKWALMYIAVALGIVAAFIYKLDLVYLLGKLLSGIAETENPISMTIFGTAITGIAIGKGSNYIHQLISNFFPSKQGLL